MKKKAAILLSAGILFVSGNLYLALKDDSKAVRSSYINQWTAAGKESLIDSLHAAGVITPLEEHYVYYNDNPGGFKRFLVKEGDQVDNGTPLYEYSGESNADRDKLDMEKNQLVREAALIDEQIKQLEYLLSVSSSSTDNSLPASGDGMSDSGSTSNELVQVSIEKEIYDKQLEKSRIMTEIQQYEETLGSQDSNDQLGTNSEVAGTVKKINYELKNPLLTIISDKPKIEGTFTEKDLKKVKEGMEVVIESDLFKGKVNGTLTKIAAYPETDPSAKTASMFPFEVELAEGEEKLVQGTHVDVSVVTDQVVNAATAPDQAVVKTKKVRYLYVLNAAGNVEKRQIKQGMDLDGKIEVEKGIKPGELIVKQPEKVQQENSPFFSKLKTAALNKKILSEEPNSNIIKSILIGFFKH